MKIFWKSRKITSDRHFWTFRPVRSLESHRFKIQVGKDPVKLCHVSIAWIYFRFKDNDTRVSVGIEAFFKGLKRFDWNSKYSAYRALGSSRSLTDSVLAELISRSSEYSALTQRLILQQVLQVHGVFTQLYFRVSKIRRYTNFWTNNFRPIPLYRSIVHWRQLCL